MRWAAQWQGGTKTTGSRPPKLRSVVGTASSGGATGSSTPIESRDLAKRLRERFERDPKLVDPLVEDYRYLTSHIVEMLSARPQPDPSIGSVW
jgi:hypothetical protein